VLSRKEAVGAAVVDGNTSSLRPRTNGGPTLAGLSSSFRRPVENRAWATLRNSWTRPSIPGNRSGLAFLRVRPILTGQQSKFDFDQEGGDHGSTEEVTNGTKRKIDSAAVSPPSLRGRSAKRTVARAAPRKRLAKAKFKRGAKKTQKRVKVVKPPTTPAVETVIVDVIEKPVPDVTVVTEFEATEVREVGGTPEEPEESRSAPPEAEEPLK